MNERQIKIIAARDPKLRSSFRGVFAANEVPSLKIGESAIVNVLNRGQGVGHWCAIFKRNDGKIELFDSLCLPESRYEFNHDIRNKIPVQPFNSQKCGQFSIFFLKARVRSVSFAGLMKMLIKRGAPHNDSFLTSSSSL